MDNEYRLLVCRLLLAFVRAETRPLVAEALGAIGQRHLDPRVRVAAEAGTDPDGEDATILCQFAEQVSASVLSYRTRPPRGQLRLFDERRLPLFDPDHGVRTMTSLLRSFPEGPPVSLALATVVVSDMEQVSRLARSLLAALGNKDLEEGFRRFTQGVLAVWGETIADPDEMLATRDTRTRLYAALALTPEQWRRLESGVNAVLTGYPNGTSERQQIAGLVHEAYQRRREEVQGYH